MSPQLAATLSALHVTEIGARRSGRTERMLANLKPGMRVICATEYEAKNLKRRAAERGLVDIEFVGLDPRYDPRDSRVASRRAPTIVTHDWVHQRYLHQLKSIEEEIDAALDHLSGVHLGFEGTEWRMTPVAPGLLDDLGRLGAALSPQRTPR